MLMKASDDSSQRVGIDISADWFDAAIKVGASFKYAQFTYSKSGLNDFRCWLQKNGIARPHLWMEATGRLYEPLAEWTIQEGWFVSVVNPRCIRDFAKSKLKMSKNDKLDARAILRFAESASLDEIRLWKPKTEAQKELRDLQLVISGLKQEIARERNRLKCGLTSALAKESLRRTIAYMEKEVKGLHRRSMELIKSDPALARHYKALRQVRGFGDVTITFLLARIDFSLFKKGRQLVKYAGLDSVEWQSGSSIRKRERISRTGHADIRSALFLPAMVARKHDPASSEMADRLISRGASKMTALCAVMCRLLRLAFALVREADKLHPEAA